MNQSFSLQNLLDDLHKLEINTIEKVAMTAQKMPAALLAIHEVIDGYESYFAWTIEGRTFNYTVSSETSTGETLVQRLDRTYADAAARFNALATDLTEDGRADRMICGRIQRNCEILRGMLRRGLAANELAPQDGSTGRLDSSLLRKTASDLRGDDPAEVASCWRLSSADQGNLRKIWEIGTEKVLIQTVIQIEGDVITRISPLVLNGERQHLLEIHTDGIETSLKMWGELVGLAERLLAAVGRAAGRIVARVA